MIVHYGAVLIEKDCVIMHIYGIDAVEHYVVHAHRKESVDTTVLSVLQIIADFLDEGTTYHVADWKLCTRGMNSHAVHQVATATGLDIETIDLAREQELLLKGMVAELL